MEERIYLAYLHVLGISQAKFFDLFSEKQNYKEIFKNLNSSHLQNIWYPQSYITKVLNKKKKLDTSKILDILKKREVNLVTIFDEGYPDALKQIPNTPYFLYVRWNLDNSAKISVVWARKITSYGQNVINKLVPDLSKYFQIVSGGALWADTAAHKVCLESQWKTIVVLWTGINIDYPVGNKILYDKIVKSNGAVVSIFPVWEQGSKYSFPMRNEIVAWLSIGTIIVEAKEKSGTLITANLSLDLWRDLYAVPWWIFSANSNGCNNLIKTSQAKLVTCSDDILNEYNISSSQKQQTRQIKFADSIEKCIYDSLLLESLSVDELCIKKKLDISSTITKLSMMEIQWYIKKNIAGKYEVL